MWHPQNKENKVRTCIQNLKFNAVSRDYLIISGQEGSMHTSPADRKWQVWPLEPIHKLVPSIWDHWHHNRSVQSPAHAYISPQKHNWGVSTETKYLKKRKSMPCTVVHHLWPTQSNSSSPQRPSTSEYVITATKSASPGHHNNTRSEKKGKLSSFLFLGAGKSVPPARFPASHAVPSGPPGMIPDSRARSNPK